MCSDALFQLGMCPVVLDITQTEDSWSMRPARAGDAGLRSHCAGNADAAFAMPRSRLRHRGNSSKALLSST